MKRADTLVQRDQTLHSDLNERVMMSSEIIRMCGPLLITEIAGWQMEISHQLRGIAPDYDLHKRRRELAGEMLRIA